MAFESQSAGHGREADLQRMLTELIAEALERVGTAKPQMSSALTAREHEVLELIASGESNKAIARSLGLSLHTVKRHVANILTKLNVTSRFQAGAWLRTHH